MTNNIHLYESEHFKLLVEKRAKMIWPLSLFLMIALAVNLYLMSSGAEIGAKTLFTNGVVTIALAYSILLIFLGAFIAGFYVRWANKNLDPLMDIVVQEAAMSSEKK